MKISNKYRLILMLSLIFLLIIIIIYTVSEIYRNRNFQEEFTKQKGHLISVEETPIENGNGYSMLQIELQNDLGVKVQGYIRFPTNGLSYPTLVMLGGLRTGKKTLDYIEVSKPLVLLALDYPYEGRKSKLGKVEFLKTLPEMRRAILNTAPAVMLSIDYLMNRKDVDPTRIILVGGSLGALFVPSIAATDTRITAAAILFGAGDLQSLLYANIDKAAPIAAVGAWIGSLLVSPVEPLKYIDKISPRPLFMLNGIDDPRMPLKCSMLLHEKAKDPKTIRWISTGHVDVRSKEFHEHVQLELELWLEQNNLISGKTFDVNPDLH